MDTFFSDIARGAKAALHSSGIETGHTALLDLATSFLGYATYVELQQDFRAIQEALRLGGHLILDMGVKHRRAQSLFPDPAVREAAVLTVAARLQQALPGQAHINDTTFLRWYADAILVPAAMADDSREMAIAQQEAGGGCILLAEAVDLDGEDFGDTRGRDRWNIVIEMNLKRPEAPYADASVGARFDISFVKHGRCAVTLHDASIRAKYFSLEAFR